MNNAFIGGQITKYRKELGMTQEELGKAVGVSTQAVSRWENGGAPDLGVDIQHEPILKPRLAGNQVPFSRLLVLLLAGF